MVMKIALCNRDPKSHVGGDVIQVYGYIKALKKLGHDAEYIHALDFDASKYDEIWLHHINFGWTGRQYQSAIKANVPYRVFAVFYPDLRSDMTIGLMHEVMKGAKSVYCFSDNEANDLKHEFSDINPIIIRNGVDKDIFNTNGAVDSERSGVLSIGRYEKFKGHKIVLEACKDLGLPVTVVGSIGDWGYFRECQNVGYGNVVLEVFDQKELAEKYYKKSRVVVCASSSERSNLTILEGAACGATPLDSVYNRAHVQNWFYFSDPLNFDKFKQDLKYVYENLINFSDKIPSWEDIIKEILKT
jgi:glycosyltransferase involved in cell wall biosynthesis